MNYLLLIRVIRFLYSAIKLNPHNMKRVIKIQHTTYVEISTPRVRAQYIWYDPKLVLLRQPEDGQYVPKHLDVNLANKYT